MSEKACAIYVDPETQESYPVENWFQSSKVFVKDGIERGPYRDLLSIRLAKRYVNPHPDKKTVEQLKGDMLFDNIQREIAGAQLSCFKLSGTEYPLLPRSAFYDYLYVSALCQPQNSSLAEGLMQFRVFTDIMFNPGTGKIKKFDTQARSCAIFVSLSKRGMPGKDIPSFEEFVATASYGGKQEAPAIKQQTLLG